MRRDVALSTFNACLGVWVVGSAFLWTHSTASLVNTIAVGLVCIGIALAASRAPAARWLYIPLSAWMFVSAWIIPHPDRFSSVNLMAIGLALFLVPLTARVLGERPQPASA